MHLCKMEGKAFVIYIQGSQIIIQLHNFLQETAYTIVYVCSVFSGVKQFQT